MRADNPSIKDQYTPVQLVCCTAARLFRDRDTVFAGVGMSFLATAIAKLLYAPNVILVAEAGYVGFACISSMVSPSDNVGGCMALCHQGLFETFRDQQAGFIDSACLGFAQIDKFGNVGVTFVRPTIRMNGSGGGGDISSSAKSVVYIGEYHPRQFREKVDYMTNPGFLDGSPDARKKAGLLGGGPECVVTNRGIFRFDLETHEMYLAEVFPWQDEKDIAEVVAAAPWRLKVAKDLKIIQPPTEDENKAIALIDPQLRYVIPVALERPAGKVMLSGRTDLFSYNYLLELNEESWRKNRATRV
ncbi:MAG: Glutaconate CoA-transferase subunit B [Syntrophaceae bacterium PtaU1.Bin231]|nr:MAG: Glutaconate CoA-transferase subunit B [Syntrophaceae bacterium PtaU1.Bin231]